MTDSMYIDFEKVSNGISPEYQQGEKNYLQVIVQLPNGEIVKTNEYIVLLSLTRDAMIGLGLNLLKHAYKAPVANMKTWDLLPATSEDSIYQDLGVFIHPKSCELRVCEADYGPVSEIFK